MKSGPSSAASCSGASCGKKKVFLSSSVSLNTVFKIHVWNKQSKPPNFHTWKKNPHKRNQLFSYFSFRAVGLWKYIYRVTRSTASGNLQSLNGRTYTSSLGTGPLQGCKAYHGLSLVATGSGEGNGKCCGISRLDEGSTYTSSFTNMPVSITVGQILCSALRFIEAWSFWFFKTEGIIFDLLYIRKKNVLCPVVLGCLYTYRWEVSHVCCT